MKRFLKIFFCISVVLAISNCIQKENSNDESILRGKATIFCDETLSPVIDDQIVVFENEYDAKITLISKSETEVLNALLNDSGQIAIISRPLNSSEKLSFKNKNIIPKITKFATDAIVFIRNNDSNDTIISLDAVLAFIKGKPQPGIKGLVFDNANSSTASHLLKLAGQKEFGENIFAFDNNEKAIKYVAENNGMVGVIGLNWILQPKPEMEINLDSIKVLSLQGKDGRYYSPTQNNLAEGKYPLARDLFIVNCQGYSGLGMGFASFIAGEKGQRIILKSGLLPVRIPSRNILIRNQISKTNN